MYKVSKKSANSKRKRLELFLLYLYLYKKAIYSLLNFAF